MPYARATDGARLYYEQHGAAGSPLVLAYGIGGNTDMWDVNVPALSAAHRVVLWEPRATPAPTARPTPHDSPSGAGRSTCATSWTTCVCGVLTSVA
jgi:pimeloyl-ACP methyl ester carboxylesterase